MSQNDVFTLLMASWSPFLFLKVFELLTEAYIYPQPSPFNVKFKSEIISIIAQSITESAEVFDSGCHLDLMDVIIVFHKFGTLIQYLLHNNVHFLQHGAMITAYLSGYCIALHYITIIQNKMVGMWYHICSGGDSVCGDKGGVHGVLWSEQASAFRRDLVRI